ncbi:hypothetical protein ACN2XU_10560 [Primorskyibacter sp. 2E107]|uniref:hypothetical protein n=1 Tax=Primorskyibacter sp. 2E107 TaxID=3403458 RepID=UPI003AF8315D
MSRDAALVRANALPVRLWLRGGNPALFAACRALQTRETIAAEEAQAVAAQIGETLVPLPWLSDGQRNRLLALRRALHAARRPSRALIEEADTIARRAEARDLAGRIMAQRRALIGLKRAREAFTARVAEEEARMLDLPGALATDDAMAQFLLRRLGAPPSGGPTKKRQRYLERAWQVITRASVEATPRDWLSHVSLIPVADGMPAPTILPGFHIHCSESVRRAQCAAQAAINSGWPRGADRVALNPLHWIEEGDCVSVVVDEAGTPSFAILAMTEDIAAVMAKLRKGAVSVSNLLSGVPDPTAARRLLRDLAGNGVLEACCDVTGAYRQSSVPEDMPEPYPWTDVYRDTGGALPDRLYRRLERALPTILRSLALFEPPYRAIDRQGEARSWSFADTLKSSLVEEHLKQNGAPSVTADSGSGLRGTDAPPPVVPRWPLPLTEGARQITLTDAELRRLAAPELPLFWPVDVVVRVGGDPEDPLLLIKGIWPAATLDSRMAEGLSQSAGMRHQMEARHARYRAFLRRIERRTGFVFVEVVAPPYSERADNAVRRPLYTSLWTGHPDARAYFAQDPENGTYVDPASLRFSRGPGGTTCRVGSQKIWPICHATRTSAAPWKQLQKTLSAAAPLSLPVHYQSLRRLMTSGETRDHWPRVTVLDGIVLCPEVVAISAEDLWPDGAETSVRLRWIETLRGKRGLSRFVEVGAPGEVDFVTVDLESVPALRILEKKVRAAGRVHIAEKLPNPEALIMTLGDGGARGSIESELVLRFYPDDACLSPEILPR